MANKSKTLISLRKINSVACTEYIKWIFNPRITIFLCMFVFVYDYVIRELLGASIEMQGKCMYLETFISVCNSPLLLLVMPAVFMTLMGDFPKTDGNTMFYIQRTGKKNWLFGQLLFAFYADITFMLAVLLSTVLFSMKFTENDNNWSDVITKYLHTFPDRTGSLVANLITGRLYNNLTPQKAFMYTFTLTALYLLFISSIMLAGFALGKRLIGIGTASLLMCAGSGLAAENNTIKWIFPSANSITWTHFDRIMKTQIYDIRYSYLYFIILIAVLLVIDVIAIDRYDFAKVTDMED